MLDPLSLCELRRTSHPPRLPPRLGVLAARCARAFANSLLLPEERAQGMPGARCTRGLVCQKTAHLAHTSIQVSGEHSDIPCAMALRLTSCSPRWSGLVVTVTLRKRPARLSASIRGARTTRLDRTQQNIRLWTAASITSRAQRVVTMAIRPSGGHETAGVILLIFRIVKRYFGGRIGQPKSA
jgi:hypothetical protein